MTFGGVYGQDQVTSVLRYQVLHDKISHAYLFCGSRGTGKTSCARLLAKSINCESPADGEPCGQCSACKSIEAGTATDVLELDAASNNGVENVRDILDDVAYMPAVLKRRVYIIDEVHMLSIAAFNALLKTLEEPPEHVVFILATTESHKIPATIISRCQRFDFKRLENKYIEEYLTKIAGAENIKLDADGARLIARLSQGGMRDAISMLELCASDGADVTEETVRAVAGVAGRGMIIKAVTAVLDRDAESIFEAIDNVYTSSLDISVFWSGLIAFYRDMLVIKATKNPRAYLELTSQEFEETSSLARRFTRESIQYGSELADDAFVRMGRPGSSKRLIAELTLVKMSDPRLGGDIGALTERVAMLEDALARGAIPAAPVGQAKKPPETPSENTNNAPEVAGADRVTAHSSREPYLRWVDAVEKYSGINGGEDIASFLGLAEAFRENGNFIIVADNPFALSFIDTDEVKKRLAAIFTNLEGQKIEPSEICFTTEKREEKHNSIDDIKI